MRILRRERVGTRTYRRPPLIFMRAGAKPAGPKHADTPLLDMAVVIRSKDAGINRLTFDIIFTSPENHEAALRSNIFHAENLAKLPGLPAERIVGTFLVDTCNAIEISVDRPNISASVDERDVCGAQQQPTIERLVPPIHAEALAKAPAFRGPDSPALGAIPAARRDPGGRDRHRLHGPRLRPAAPGRDLPQPDALGLDRLGAPRRSSSPATARTSSPPRSSGGSPASACGRSCSC